jgi:outer membrane protein TolC
LPDRLPELPEQAVVLDDLERQAVLRSIDLEELRWQMRAAHGEAGVYRLQRWLPELGVGALAEREDDGQWAVGPAVAISVPIFDRKRGAIVSSEAEARGAELRYRARAVAIRAAARTARARLEHARRRVEHIRDVLLPLRQRILDQAILQYNAMNLSLFGLLQAKREQIETGRQYVEGLRDYWLARTTIDQIQAGRAADMDAPGGRAPVVSPGPDRDAH